MSECKLKILLYEYMIHSYSRDDCERIDLYNYLVKYHKYDDNLRRNDDIINVYNKCITTDAINKVFSDIQSLIKSACEDCNC